MEVKQAYQEKAEAQLREWRDWIEQYKLNPNLPARSRFQSAEQAVRRLDESYLAVLASLNNLRRIDDLQWEAAKQRLEQAMINLKKVLDDSGACRAGELLKLQIHRNLVYGPFERKE